ncbi:MAG: preprotein translocase subunit TatB [Candidatus Omnitrophica bacterium CG1_02_49_10]|nr:MAG: preprotein translocase subunit TatB [Candidatus Omnitrophica bacterium CG1_02_49_10]
MTKKHNVKEKLDLRGILCPINFVKTKLKLEQMAKDEILEVIIDNGEPMKHVPKSVKHDGHMILEVIPMEGDSFRLIIRKS